MFYAVASVAARLERSGDPRADFRTSRTLTNQQEDHAKRTEMEGKGICFLVARRLGKRRALPDKPEEWIEDLIKTAEAQFRVEVEHPIKMI